jgi:hypothetical protein
LVTLGRRLLSGAGAVGAATAALLYVAVPASAADTTYYADTASSGKYLARAGEEDFFSDGDNFQVCDNDADGAGVIGYWKVGSSGTVHSIYDGNGLGTCVPSNQDFAESAVIYIKACIRDDGDVKEGTCSSWVKAYADGVP